MIWDSTNKLWVVTVYLYALGGQVVIVAHSFELLTLEDGSGATSGGLTNPG